MANTINYGLQSIVWKYKTPLKASYLSTMFAGVLDPGVYAGCDFTLVSERAVKFNTGHLIIADKNFPDVYRFKVYFSQSWVLTTPSAGTGFIVARYEFEEGAETYVDIRWENEPLDTDVILAVPNWADISTGTLVNDPNTFVSYDQTTYPVLRQLDDTKGGELKPVITQDTDETWHILFNQGQVITSWGVKPLSVFSPQGAVADTNFTMRPGTEHIVYLDPIPTDSAIGRLVYRPVNSGPVPYQYVPVCSFFADETPNPIASSLQIGSASTIDFKPDYSDDTVVPSKLANRPAFYTPEGRLRAAPGAALDECVTLSQLQGMIMSGLKVPISKTAVSLVTFLYIPVVNNANTSQLLGPYLYDDRADGPIVQANYGVVVPPTCGVCTWQSGTLYRWGGGPWATSAPAENSNFSNPGSFAVNLGASGKPWDLQDPFADMSAVQEAQPGTAAIYESDTPAGLQGKVLLKFGGTASNNYGYLVLGDGELQRYAPDEGDYYWADSMNVLFPNENVAPYVSNSGRAWFALSDRTLATKANKYGWEMVYDHTVDVDNETLAFDSSGKLTIKQSFWEMFLRVDGGILQEGAYISTDLTPYEAEQNNYNLPYFLISRAYMQKWVQGVIDGAFVLIFPSPSYTFTHSGSKLFYCGYYIPNIESTSKVDKVTDNTTSHFSWTFSTSVTDITFNANTGMLSIGESASPKEFDIICTSTSSTYAGSGNTPVIVSDSCHIILDF